MNKTFEACVLSVVINASTVGKKKKAKLEKEKRERVYIYSCEENSKRYPRIERQDPRKGKFGI